MNPAARSIQDHDALHQTAMRLISALGKEGAIFICRANYWHGILKLIENQTTVSSASA